MGEPDSQIGFSFESFLDKQGILELCTATDIRRIRAPQNEHAMQDRRLTKSAMATAMNTSRRQLDRLLEPSNPSVNMDTLPHAAVAMGRKLRLDLA
jgi:hypothetical protein